MTNDMVKFFAGVTLCISILFLLLVSVLSNSASLDDGGLLDWNFAIIIDAGSTGSRLFLYQYRAAGDHQLIDAKPVRNKRTFQPVVKKVEPGLSSFGDKPLEAAGYMKPLLDYASEFIPSDQLPYTSLFIFATAGMRLLSKSAQDAVLNNLRTNLTSISAIQIIPDHIKVIEGRWEGIYSWIAVNYILGRFNRNSSETSRQPTVGIVDMGGASAQIAVELNETGDGLKGVVENVNLGSTNDDYVYQYRLYVATFLGYGVNEGLRKYEQKLSDDLKAENKTDKIYVSDPCLSTNLIKVVYRKDGTNFLRRGYGDWKTCVARLSALLASDVSNSDCQALKCFLGLVRAPSLSLSNVELYGFSEYWYSLQDVFSMGGPYDFSKVSMKAQYFCKSRWSLIKSEFRNDTNPKLNEERLRAQCFKSAWIIAVLHSGFSVDKISNRFQTVFDVNGQEAHWALGALLYHMRYFPLHKLVQRLPGVRSFNPVTSSKNWM